MPRNATRAAGITTQGSGLATRAPTFTAARRCHGRNPGTSRASSPKVLAASRTSSGRITPSTNPTVNARPRGSLSIAASRAAALSTGWPCAYSSQRRTVASTSGTRADSSAMAAGSS